MTFPFNSDLGTENASPRDSPFLAKLNETDAPEKSAMAVMTSSVVNLHFSTSSKSSKVESLAFLPKLVMAYEFGDSPA